MNQCAVCGVGRSARCEEARGLGAKYGVRASLYASLSLPSVGNRLPIVNSFLFRLATTLAPKVGNVFAERHEFASRQTSPAL